MAIADNGDSFLDGKLFRLCELVNCHGSNGVGGEAELPGAGNGRS